MKKSSVVMLCIISLLVGFICGFSISTNINTANTTEEKNNVVGAYKTSSWNGKEGSLVFDSDGTCYYPTRDVGTWSVEGDTIYIKLPDENPNSPNEYSLHTADIVPNGVVLHGQFFEKL